MTAATAQRAPALSRTARRDICVRRQTSGPFARWGSTALFAACSRHLALQVSIARRAPALSRTARRDICARCQTSGPFARWGFTALFAACSRHPALQVSIARMDLPRRSCARKVLFARMGVLSSHARLATHARWEARWVSHARQGSCACWGRYQTARGGFSARMRRVQSPARQANIAPREASWEFHAWRDSRASLVRKRQETVRWVSIALPQKNQLQYAQARTYAQQTPLHPQHAL